MSSKTYLQLQKEIAELQRQAEEIRHQEVAAVITDIKAKMADYGLTVADLSDGARSKAMKTSGRSNVAAKYRDPASGAAWSGRGRTPKWLDVHEAAGRKREEFLVR